MIVQNTPEWRAARAGKFTASRFCDLLAFGKRDGKPLKARTDYIGEVVAELLTGDPREEVRAKPLDWGHDVEAAARAAYEAETGVVVEAGGFVVHPTMPFLGCSPDGLPPGGLIQIKCPYNPAVHIETIRNGMNEDHIWQVQGEMFVTGRPWCDFVSFDPRMPERRRIYIQRVTASAELHAEIERAARSAWAEVQSILEFINSEAA